jgi:hypothetical protein
VAALSLSQTVTSCRTRVAIASQSTIRVSGYRLCLNPCNLGNQVQLSFKTPIPSMLTMMLLICMGLLNKRGTSHPHLENNRSLCIRLPKIFQLIVTIRTKVGLLVKVVHLQPLITFSSLIRSHREEESRIMKWGSIKTLLTTLLLSTLISYIRIA